MERQEISENVEALYNSIKLSLDLLKDRLAKYDEELTNTILSYCHVNRDHVTKQASTEQNSTSNTVEEETGKEPPGADDQNTEKPACQKELPFMACIGDSSFACREPPHACKIGKDIHVYIHCKYN